MSSVSEFERSVLCTGRTPQGLVIPCKCGHSYEYHAMALPRGRRSCAACMCSEFAPPNYVICDCSIDGAGTDCIEDGCYHERENRRRGYVP